MPITKSLAKKAHRMVVALEEVEGGAVAYWEPYKLNIYGVNPTEALAQMEAAQEILKTHPDAYFSHSPDNKRMVDVGLNGKWLSSSYRTPHELLTMLKEGAEFGVIIDEDNEPEPDAAEQELPGIEELIPPTEVPHEVRLDHSGYPGDGTQNPHTSDHIAEQVAADPVQRLNGVPVDGAIAYKEGIASGDCPFSSEDEYEAFEKWNADWDAAADAAEEGEEKKPGSVVKDKYRAIYAERGHPAHCGDWLATILNNLCIANGATDIERFKSIMDANGIDMKKYKTTGNGWQGRYRMTGRNLLARRLFSAEFLLAPDMNGEMQKYPVPQEWKDAQTFVREAPVGKDAQSAS